IPNPSLTPETAWSFELGNATRWSGVLGWDVALFWTEAYHLIEPDVDLAGHVIQFRNVAHARLAGVDLAVDATPLARLTPSFAARVLLTNALDYIYHLVPRTLAPVRTLSVTLTWTY